MSFVEEFRESVKSQAIDNGYDQAIADAIAAKAVLNRLDREEGLVVAESDAFEPQEYSTFSMDVESITVDESQGAGTVVTMSLANSIIPNNQGFQWTNAALQSFSNQINAGSVKVLAPDEHGEWRATGSRENSETIADWVTSKVVDGSLIVKTKLKQGWEWVADKYSQVSIEAKVPRNKIREQNGTKLIDEAHAVGFIFTPKSKNPLNRVLSVVKDIFTK